MSTCIRISPPALVLVCASIIIAILLLILLTLYVIVPAIVRSTIAKAQLNFRSVSIEQIEIDRFRLKAELELSRTGVIPATILPPLAITVDDIGTVINNQSIEITGGSSNSTIVPIDSPFVISDIRAFQNFSRALIFEEQVVWNLQAKAKIQPIGSFMLSYSNIPFDKQVTINALYGLPNVSIESINFNRSDERQILIDIVIRIVNPSVFSIDVGELQFVLEYNNETIGFVQSVSNNITLIPGTNHVVFVGELKSSSNKSYSALSHTIQNYLTNQSTEIQVVAGPNATSYPLLATALAGLILNVDMAPFEKKVIDSLQFESMSLIPSNDDKSVTISASIIIRINSPLGNRSPLAIQKMDLDSFLVYENGSVGLLQIFNVPVEQLDVTTYRSKFDNQTLRLTEPGVIYEKFSRAFIDANTINPIKFYIFGKASIVGSFALGPLNIDGILLSNEVLVVGLDKLSQVLVHGISIDGETEEGLLLSIDATINNTGVSVVELRDFTFELLDAQTDIPLGKIPIDVLTVAPGRNDIVLHGLIVPQNESDLPIFGRFFSVYLNGHTQPVRLFHGKSSTINATAMDLTVSGLSIVADLSGINGHLIRNVDVLDFGIYFDPNDTDRVLISGRFEVLFQLPPNVHMSFLVTAVSIDYIVRSMDGKNIGRMVLIDNPVKHNQTTNEIVVAFDKHQLQVLDREAFKLFAADLVLTKNVSLVIEGLVTAVAHLQIGVLNLSDIPLNQTIRLVGYDQFGGGLLKINQIDIIGAMSSDQLMLSVLTNISNPSVVNILNGGRLTLELADVNHVTSLGLVNIDPFVLEAQGTFTVTDAEGIFSIDEKNQDSAREFISRMVSGLENSVVLQGSSADNSTGTSVPLLETAIKGLQIQTIVPGLTGDKALVQEIIIKRLTAAEILGIALGRVKILETRIHLVNPFKSSLLINSLDIRADYADVVDEDAQIGVVQETTELLVKPYSELITPYLTVHLTAKLSTMATLLGPLVAGTAHLSLSGVVDVTIGDEFKLIQIPLTVLNVKTDQEASTSEDLDG